MSVDLELRRALDRIDHAANVLAYALDANQRHGTNPVDLGVGPLETAYQTWAEAREALDRIAGGVES